MVLINLAFKTSVTWRRARSALRRPRPASPTASNDSSEDQDTADAVKIRVESLQQTTRSKIHSELQKLAAWRKTGPMGKLHNIIVSIQTSSQRTDLFEAVQRELADEREILYKPVSDGAIRWNSTHDMAEVNRFLDTCAGILTQYSQ